MNGLWCIAHKLKMGGEQIGLQAYLRFLIMRFILITYRQEFRLVKIQNLSIMD